MWRNAGFAAHFRRLLSGHPATEKTAPAGAHGPADNTAPRSKPIGCDTLKDRAQAIETYRTTRSQKALARVRRLTLESLRRGRCSDA